MDSHITRTYTSGQVERAVGLPARRLEGWAQRGLVTTKKQRGRTRHGDRRLFGFGDVMIVAVLGELQKLLGASMFRPGAVARLVAEHMHRDPFGLMASVPDTILVLSAPRGKLTVEVLYNAALSAIPLSAVVIRLTPLAKMVAKALNDA